MTDRKSAITALVFTCIMLIAPIAGAANVTTFSGGDSEITVEVRDGPDHNNIVDSGVRFLRHELNHEVTSELLPRKFTLSQLQELHEIVLGQKFDKRNFRKQAINNGVLEQTNEKQKGVAHKPARLYTFKDLN